MKVLAHIALLLVVINSCAVVNTEETIRGKVIHRSCATIAVQVIGNKHTSLGQASWQQADGKPVYKNVFSVGNRCAFPTSLSEGKEFQFTVMKSDPSNDDCMVCEMWDNPPTKVLLVRVKNTEE